MRPLSFVQVGLFATHIPIVRVGDATVTTPLVRFIGLVYVEMSMKELRAQVHSKHSQSFKDASCAECQTQFGPLCIHCGSSRHVSTYCPMTQWAAYLRGESPHMPEGRTLEVIEIDIPEEIGVNPT